MRKKLFNIALCSTFFALFTVPGSILPGTQTAYAASPEDRHSVLSRHALRRAQALDPDFQPLKSPSTSEPRYQLQDPAVKNRYRKTPVIKASLSGLSLSPIAGNRAHLRGRIQANGPVRLYLRLHEGQEVREIRYLGSLELRREEGPVLFSFLSPLPEFRSNQWSWQVEVRRG
jgi:hypothetical protein